MKTKARGWISSATFGRIVSVVAALSIAVIGISVRSVNTSTPHPSSCAAGYGCVNRDNPPGTGCTIFGWNWSATDNSDANLTGYFWGGVCGATTDVNDDPDNMKNRQSVTGRMLCIYRDINHGGTSWGLPYSVAEPWTLIGNGLRNEGSSVRPVPNGNPC